MKYLFYFLTISVLLMIPFVFAQGEENGQILKTPETFEEAESIGLKFLSFFPWVLKMAWQEGMAVWQEVLVWIKDLWQSYISPWLQGIWENIKIFLGKEVEQRKAEVEEEFEKEKEELKREIPKVSKSLWERFKELVKW